ncbi:hypothetical protein SIAM614_20321 [Stappia aggregata IAM 12614]|uniref:Uncharacterized protein n=1 Tax=Roseibium aggregatum (strain ATCC 25650 / DSM 13394 / JCM 20685 / NBRC 16684 / NCIMB 2208 / IAM 12614 / B1) TaxID=384765 RepID=A0NW41_ROSAI|nr:hypothetical protein SIAM614_20321 [Stappia aggregata IAM 12614] [Roseibium aggregatum IAM 12614]
MSLALGASEAASIALKAEGAVIAVLVGPDELVVGPASRECGKTRPDLEQERQDRA